VADKPSEQGEVSTQGIEYVEQMCIDTH
jgi:hypothetical protein